MFWAITLFSETGLGRVLPSVQAFLAEVRWGWSGAVWWGMLPLILSVIEWRLSRRRDRSTIGRASTLFGLIYRRGGRVWLPHLLWSMGWCCFLIALADPRYGETEPDGVAFGRDLVFVIDVSRSMLAEDTSGPTRWQAARKLLEETIRRVQREPGHRIGIVVFASRPVVLVPLTTDSAHVQMALAELDGRRPPPGVLPSERSTSGTRIGSALQMAFSQRDPRFPTAHEVVIFTDGDDPRDDREHLLGVNAARQIDRPIHVVAIGNSSVDSPILIDGQMLEFRRENGVGDVVQTRMQEAKLQAIARDTGGEYWRADDNPETLPTRMATRLLQGEARLFDDEAVMGRRSYAYLFYLAALLCFLASWLGRR
ncbi:MAG: vWA domain-containing protein [Fimbriiglobus sp.]